MSTTIKKEDDLKKLQKKLEKVDQNRRDRLAELCGSIKVEEDPLEYQKEIRSEWDDRSH